MDARWMNQTPTEPIFEDVIEVDVDARRALRRHHRMPCDVVSHYWDQAVSHQASDISPYGVWIDTLTPLHPGAEVVMSFRPPQSDKELTVFGEVRRVVTGRRRGDRGRIGMGIAFTETGEVWVDRQRVDPRSVRGHVERLHAENPEGAVVILADDKSETGLVIEVLDQARLAGVDQVAVAATPN